MAKRYQTRKRVRKSSGVKNGGFYPSVMGGIGTASYLAPLALRQGIKLFRNNKTRKQRKTRKTRKIRKTRKNN